VSPESVIVASDPVIEEFILDRFPQLEGCKVVCNPGWEDVRGRVVYGNVSLMLASLAVAVYAIEFLNPDVPYEIESVHEMALNGAYFRCYSVECLESPGYSFHLD
jgi:hypothetical protein